LGHFYVHGPAKNHQVLLNAKLDHLYERESYNSSLEAKNKQDELELFAIERAKNKKKCINFKTAFYCKKEF
jgi:hypothetical protein